MTATLGTGPRQTGPRTPVHPAAELLHEARAQERAARISDAMASYQAAIAAAESAGEPALLAEALRRLAVIRHHRNESDEARRLCHASSSAAHAAGNDLLAAEALNTLGGIDLETDADAYLGGLCLVNHAKVHVARERYEDARRDAEASLAVFDRLGVGSAKADAYRVLGMIYRETGRPALAESRLKSAIELAVGAGSV